MEYLRSLDYWHWFVAALAFGILEMVLPGVVFLWMAFGAIVAGLVLLVADVGWEIQFLVFAVVDQWSLAHRAGQNVEKFFIHLALQPGDGPVQPGEKAFIRL